ncbi:hypothetical protein AX774_g707, partial [Zancudomyces culisetae]
MKVRFQILLGVLAIESFNPAKAFGKVQNDKSYDLKLNKETTPSFFPPSPPPYSYPYLQKQKYKRRTNKQQSNEQYSSYEKLHAYKGDGSVECAQPQTLTHKHSTPSSHADSKAYSKRGDTICSNSDCTLGVQKVAKLLTKRFMKRGISRNHKRQILSMTPDALKTFVENLETQIRIKLSQLEQQNTLSFVNTDSTSVNTLVNTIFNDINLMNIIQQAVNNLIALLTRENRQ